MGHKILVALQTFSEYDDRPFNILNESGAEIVLNKLGRRLNQAEIIELGEGCDGVLAGVEPYDKNVLNQLEGLKCISRCGVGVDNIDLVLAKQKGIAVLNTPDVVIQPVAEMTLALTFDLLRRLTQHTRSLQSGRWERYVGHLLSGRKVGIVGLGRIGRRTAELFRSLGAEVYGYDLKPDRDWSRKAGVLLLGLEELLGSVEILSLHVTLSAQSPFKLGRVEILKLRKGCLLINTSRGQVIDEGALYEALKIGQVGGAGLDVFSQEPYAGPLLELENVVLTPHVSTLTEESRTEMEFQAAQNMVNFFNRENNRE